MNFFTLDATAVLAFPSGKTIRVFPWQYWQNSMIFLKG